MSQWQTAYARLSTGADPTGKAIVSWLVTAGWKADRVLKNLVTKTYGPNHAALWIYNSSQNDQYWLNGSYVSEGRNALENCYCSVDPLAGTQIMDAQLSTFLADAERHIHSTFAIRFLSWPHTSRGAFPDGSFIL